MKHLKRFNENFMIDPVTKIFLGITAVSAIIYFMIRVISNYFSTKILISNRTEMDISIINRVRRALSRADKVELIIDDEGHHFAIRNIIFTISKNKRITFNNYSFDIQLSNSEYSQFIKIVDLHKDVSSRKSYPKIANGIAINSKFELPLTKFHPSEIKWIKDNMKNYHIIEITNYKWEYDGSEKSFDLSKDEGVSLEIKQKNESRPNYINILKNIDDYFIITEYFNPNSKKSWSRFLIADQFDELQNYIKSL